jgi:hypothetical protein
MDHTQILEIFSTSALVSISKRALNNNFFL